MARSRKPDQTAASRTDDDDDDMIGSPAVRNTAAIASAELRQFIERWEEFESEKKALAAEQKDIMSEAKARGYDTKVMRRIIAERKRDEEELAEEQAILELYRTALGMS